VIFQNITGINLFSFKIWFIVPVGALGIGLLAGGGGLLAARVTNYSPKIIDAMWMALFAGFSMFLIYYIEYSTMVLSDGRRVSDFINFELFMKITLTENHMRLGRGGRDAGRVGEFGYFLAAAEFIGFLVGGLASYGILMKLDQCHSCSAYMRKLKTSESGIVSNATGDEILRHMREGSIDELVSMVRGQAPKTRKTSSGFSTNFTHRLLGCPKCKAEALEQRVSMFVGNEWKDIPELRRRVNFKAGTSFRAAFEASRTPLD
jgi:hypothetical protein